MTTYRTRCDTCEDEYITDSWVPSECPFCQLRKLQKAASDLYLAGKWITEKVSEDEQARLWKNLRDAACIPEGTETERASRKRS